MAASTQTLSAQVARRLLLHTHGLLAPAPGGPCTPQRLLSEVNRLGFVQLDTIAVVERAHHHIAWSRLPAYAPGMLEGLHASGALFEHMTHDASLIPTPWWPHWRHRFQRVAWKTWIRQRLGKDGRRVLDGVRARIAAEGPLMARDFEGPRRAKGAGGWWEWKPAKAALELLWRTGELSVARRVNFHKVYDLTERVLPAAWAAPTPDPAEHVDWACRTAMERLVVATPGEVAAFWKAIPPAAARAWMHRAAAAGELVPVRVEAFRPRARAAPAGPPRSAFALADWQARAAALPDPPARTVVLSPFDPVLRDRARAERLFGFAYRFEAFTPAPRRTFGYYVLPVLEGDRTIARLDARVDRDAAALELLGLWWEPHAKPTPARRRTLHHALETYAHFCGATTIKSPT